MKIECNEGAAFTLIITAVAIAAAVTIVGLEYAASKARVECYKTQQAAIAAQAATSAPVQRETCR